MPHEAQDNPMVRMFLTFLREGKKDIRRMPEDFIINLSRPIGQAFTWVAEGGSSLENDLFNVPSYESDPDDSSDDSDDSSDDDDDSDSVEV